MGSSTASFSDGKSTTLRYMLCHNFFIYLLPFNKNKLKVFHSGFVLLHYTSTTPYYTTTTYATPYYTEVPNYTTKAPKYCTTDAVPSYYTEAPKYYSAPSYTAKALECYTTTYAAPV